MNKATAHCTVFLARMTLGRKPLEVRQSRGVAPPASISPACFLEVFLESG